MSTTFLHVWKCLFFTDIETAQGEQGAGSEADGGGWRGRGSGLKEKEGQGRRVQSHFILYSFTV